MYKLKNRFLLALSIFLLQISSPLFSQEINKEKELATYMGELQRITHKLSLSAHAGNIELLKFYLHESLHSLEEIQEQVPLYEDIPVAILVDRIALPAYRPLRELLKHDAKKKLDKSQVAPAVKKIIDSCNQCHTATKHTFIKITNSKSNPFNQDFTP